MKTEKIICIIKDLTEKHAHTVFYVWMHTSLCVSLQHLWINTNGDIDRVSSVISFSIKNWL